MASPTTVGSTATAPFIRSSHDRLTNIAGASRTTDMKFIKTLLFLTCLAAAYAQPATPTLTTLHSFAGGADGVSPSGALVRGSKGVLYGATGFGGDRSLGTVFSLTPPPAGYTQWTEKVLHSFSGGSDDGYEPVGPIVLDSEGNLYGTTFGGGLYSAGTIFELSPPSDNTGDWTETILVNFNGNTGLYGATGLVSDAAGNLYGAATGYQGNQTGGVFELSPNPWTLATLYVFQGGGDGGVPDSLALDSHGNLFGTTALGRPVLQPIPRLPRNGIRAQSAEPDWRSMDQDYFVQLHQPGLWLSP